MQSAARDAWRYGDPENHDLRHALGDKLGIGPDRIVVGEGIDGLLGYLVRLLVEPGDPVVTSDGAYPTFNYHVAGFGGVLHKVSYREDHEDLDGLLAAVQKTGAKLVYLANPDNPMGTVHPASAVSAFLDKLPSDTVLCLDEAYIEFAPAGTAPPLEPAAPNLVRMRTFSKAHGLAGLRIGYAIADPDLATAFGKVRNHFGVSRVAQATACASLEDDRHLNSVVDAVERSRARITQIAASHGMTPVGAAANFQTLDTHRGSAFAKRLVQALGRHGVFVRMPFVEPQNRCIRVSAGPDAEMDVLERVFEAAVNEAEEV